MKASELRIGNYILNDSNKIVYVTSISDFSVMHTERKKTVSIKTGSQTELCKPIPLTEEWLVKLGCDKNLKGLYFKDSFEFSIGIDHVMIFYNTLYLIHCEHVHTFQNLYFALTGKELT